MELTEDDLDRIAALFPYFDRKRIASCPYCHCVTAWINSHEFGQHVFRCIQIDHALHLEEATT